jgi:hypothetical protein
MKNLDYVLKRVHTGASVRFREDFKRGRRLTNLEMAAVKDAIRKQAVA